MTLDRTDEAIKRALREWDALHNRNYEDDWGARYQGLLEEVRRDGTANHANQLAPENLKGKLSRHTRHDGYDRAAREHDALVVDALIDASRDFDLLLFPSRSHGFRREPYMMRRRCDYFVRHLLGAEPAPAHGAVRMVTRRAPARRSGQRVSAYPSTWGPILPLGRCDSIASA